MWKTDWRKAVLKDLNRYGFGLTDDNRIVLKSGNHSSVVIHHNNNISRLQARSTTGNLLWTGKRISAFLEAFWHATPNH